MNIYDVSKMIIGMRINDAKFFVESKKFHFRIISDDGLQFYYTDGYAQNRINVEVIDNIVRESRVG